jgi:hypothetical protein
VARLRTNRDKEKRRRQPPFWASVSQLNQRDAVLAECKAIFEAAMRQWRNMGNRNRRWKGLHSSQP